MAEMQRFNPYGYGMYNPQTMYQAQMQQAWQQAMQPQQPTQQQIGVAAHLVTSFDEANAAQIPFDNTINLFVNLAAGEIYIKRFNPNTGGAPIAIYRQKPQDEDAQVQFAPLDMVRALEGRVNEISEIIAGSTKRTAQRGAKADE